jgi:hypothetical protein
MERTFRVSSSSAARVRGAGLLSFIDGSDLGRLAEGGGLRLQWRALAAQRLEGGSDE